MALVNLNFESQYLNGNTEVSIILPDRPRGINAADFYENGAKYKVLWLLHGGFGDHSDWLRKSMIELYACERDLIVVMPSALNSFYSNWPVFMMGYSVYDYIIKELMPLVYNWFPASEKREDNYVAGLSMGGFGTAKLAANHPEKFAAAAVLSAAPVNVRNLKGALDTQIFHSLINNTGGMEAFEDSPDNTFRILLDRAKEKNLPRLYFACGKEDFLYNDIYLPFKEYSQKNGIPITFEEYDNYEHEWRFWDLTIQKALAFFGLDKTDSGNLF